MIFKDLKMFYLQKGMPFSYDCGVLFSLKRALVELGVWHIISNFTS